jgi:cell division transport system permease protein
MESFAIRLKGLAGIDDVEYGRKWVEGFLTVVDLARLVCLAAGGFLFIAMVFIVSNTIRLAIYHRKDEIEIMKLVGATNFFVRAPFLIEGTLQGLFGSALSLAILFGVYRLLLVKAVPTLEPLVGPLTLSFLSRDYSVGIMMAGLFLGILGSMVSIEKFLRASP